jgi:hypothetical protein
MKINGGTPEDTITAQTLLLRRMNHREWLVQFSETLLAQYRRPDGTTEPMTPFRAGVISRLKQAAAYIKLLEDERRELQKKIDDALALIGGAKIPESPEEEPHD